MITPCSPRGDSKDNWSRVHDDCCKVVNKDMKTKRMLHSDYWYGKGSATKRRGKKIRESTAEPFV